MPKALPVIDVSARPAREALLVDRTAGQHAFQVVRLVADPVRIKLMSILLTDAENAVCTCDLAVGLGLAESTVSHHLTQLRKAGMVESQRRGMNVYHLADRRALDALRTVLDPNCCR